MKTLFVFLLPLIIGFSSLQSSVSGFHAPTTPRPTTPRPTTPRLTTPRPTTPRPTTPRPTTPRATTPRPTTPRPTTPRPTTPRPTTPRPTTPRPTTPRPTTPRPTTPRPTTPRPTTPPETTPPETTPPETTPPRTTPPRTTPPSCQLPFEDIGGRCVMVDNMNSGSWDSMKHICEMLGARLIKLDEANFFRDIVVYIKENDLTDVPYWIGASDEGHEGDWRWTDGTAVDMGTPYWGYSIKDNIQAPNGGTKENCANLGQHLHYYFNDNLCSESRSVICEA